MALAPCAHIMIGTRYAHRLGTSTVRCADMAHLTAYIPAHLHRRYQDEWPRDQSFSAWLQEELTAKLDAEADLHGLVEAEPAGI